MRQIKFSTEARNKMKIGIDKVADAVKCTLGPSGRNVILDRGVGSPIVTNDGVSVAREVILEDPFENVGAQFIREVANKTNETAADGTTTSTTIAQILITNGLRLIEVGFNPMDIKEGMELAKKDATKYLKKSSTKLLSLKKIIQVATISAESKDMGRLIGEAMHTIGVNGVVTIEESSVFGMSSDVISGMHFDTGFVSPSFVTIEAKNVCILNDPLIFVTTQKVSTVNDALSVLELLDDKKEIVIIADTIDGEALKTLEINTKIGAINALAVNAPSYGDNRKKSLEDIAIYCGATLAEELKDITVSMFGKAKKIISERDKTTIIEGIGDTKSRVASLKNELLEARSIFDKEVLNSRIAKLTGGVAAIKVGAPSSMELTYLKHKLDDTIAATRAAMDEGIVAGGGVALVKASQVKSKLTGGVQAGYDAVMTAIKEPFMQILRNGGVITPDVAIEKVLKTKSKNSGYDAKKNIFVKNMVAKGIIDPVKVTRIALENAVSVASYIITTECIIIDEKPSESSK